MKKIIFIAIMATIASVSVFTACNKDVQKDNSNVNTPITSVKIAKFDSNKKNTNGVAEKELLFDPAAFAKAYEDMVLSDYGKKIKILKCEMIDKKPLDKEYASYISFQVFDCEKDVTFTDYRLLIKEVKDGKTSYTLSIDDNKKAGNMFKVLVCNSSNCEAGTCVAQNADPKTGTLEGCSNCKKMEGATSFTCTPGYEDRVWWTAVKFVATLGGIITATSALGN